MNANNSISTRIRRVADGIGARIYALCEERDFPAPAHELLAEMEHAYFADAEQWQYLHEEYVSDPIHNLQRHWSWRVVRHAHVSAA